MHRRMIAEAAPSPRAYCWSPARRRASRPTGSRRRPPSRSGWSRTSCWHVTWVTLRAPLWCAPLLELQDRDGSWFIDAPTTGGWLRRLTERYFIERLSALVVEGNTVSWTERLSRRSVPYPEALRSSFSVEVCASCCAAGGTMPGKQPCTLVPFLTENPRIETLPRRKQCFLSPYWAPTRRRTGALVLHPCCVQLVWSSV